MLGMISESICQWWVVCRCEQCRYEEKPVNNKGREIAITQQEAVTLFQMSGWCDVWISSEIPDEFSLVLSGVCPDCHK